MKVFYGFDNLTHLRGTVCTVGSYDGVHIGHIALIRECIAQAKRIGAQSVVLTFEPHPRIVLGKAEGLKLLTTLEEKIVLLENEGVDNLVVIPFDRAFSLLSYGDFVKEYLLAKLNMKCMVIGYNHLFGRGNEGNYTLLQRLSEEQRFEVVRLPELRSEEAKVSSTVIRNLIEKGEMKQANRYLAREYLMIYPPSPLKLIPPQGKYLAKVNGQVTTIYINDNGNIESPIIQNGSYIEVAEDRCLVISSIM